MTSPVNTEVKWARSTMPGAPVLTREAGSLISLIDALCVDGWGLQTASSVVVAGGIATATFPLDHGAAPHAVVLVAGVTGALAGLNGEQKVIAAKANQVRWATAEADGTASGTITVKMAAAGWTKEFSGTNLAAYKSAKPQSHGQYLRIDDTTAQYNRAVGYENMTAVSTGTGPFPTNAEMSGGYYWGKTRMASGTDPAPWMFGSDGRTLYLLALTSSTAVQPFQGTAFLMPFGDMAPESSAGDPFATLIAGGRDSYLQLGAMSLLKANLNTYVAVPRAQGGAGAAVCGRTFPLVAEDNTQAPPNPISGALACGPIYYRDNDSAPPRARWRGVLRSVGYQVENLQLPPFSIFGGHGSAKAYAYAPITENTGDSSYFRAMLLDITGPWEA